MGVVSLIFGIDCAGVRGQAGGLMDAHQDMRTPLAWTTPSCRGHG